MGSEPVRQIKLTTPLSHSRSDKVDQAIRRELGKGRGIHTVAKAVGVGTGTVQRVRAELALAG